MHDTEVMDIIMADPGSILNFTNLLVHAIPAILAGVTAGVGSYFSIKYSVKVHTNKIADLELISDWNTRRIDKIFTVHSMRHPEDDLSVPYIRQLPHRDN